MTEIATIDWFGRWGISVFSENAAIFLKYTALTIIGHSSEIFCPINNVSETNFFITI